MKTLKGSLTALVTPFKNGAVDADAFQRLVDRQIRAGTAGVVPAGSTGESATLAYDEHFRVIELAVEGARAARPRAEGEAIRAQGLRAAEDLDEEVARSTATTSA